MSDYQVEVVLERALTEDEVRTLTLRRAAPISKHTMEGEGVVIVHLDAPDSLTASDAAAIHVQRATGLAISSAQVLPQPA